MIENQGFLEKFSAFGRDSGFRGRFSETLAPDLVPGIRNHQPADHSTHAVTDQNDALPARKRAGDRIELLTKESRRVGIRITAGITENPKLVAAPEFGVVPQRIDHRRPAGGRVLQAMDEDYRDAIRVERL